MGLRAPWTGGIYSPAFALLCFQLPPRDGAIPIEFFGVCLYFHACWSCQPSGLPPVRKFSFGVFFPPPPFGATSCTLSALPLPSVLPCALRFSSAVYGIACYMFFSFRDHPGAGSGCMWEPNLHFAWLVARVLLISNICFSGNQCALMWAACHLVSATVCTVCASCGFLHCSRLGVGFCCANLCCPR